VHGEGPDRPTIDEYRLRLEVDFGAGSWEGSVEFDLPSGVDPLELDSDGLEIRSARRNGSSVPFHLEPAEQRLRIEPGPAGPSKVSVAFAGRVVDQTLIGLYRCAHGDGYVLTSQCEPTGARRIFPCVDRPDRKSRFRLTVATEPSLEVVSNTPADAVREADGRREWTFAPTPTMSTYLLYFAVGRFDRAESSLAHVPVRTLTAPHRGASGTFGAESGARILTAYEEYYGIPYPLPKLDLLAVSEHGFGAMENWGAISFREMRLLVDPGSSSYARRDIFETIAHEIAHQWFGDLVTMRWWNDVWLNESFATFLETKITERLSPEFHPLDDFLLRPWGTIGARHGDSLRAAHPVRVDVTRPEEISQVFDAISYGKGSSVLRMLEHYLGEEPFRAGVAEYLRRFAYRNARSEDLWTALEQSTGRRVHRLVDPWFDRPGIPVVRARIVPEGLALRQQRFSYHGATDEEPWPIPLELDVDGERRALLFDTREQLVAVPRSATVHLNPGAVGYYRVWYDPALLDRLLSSLPSRPGPDRWTVLNDLAAFFVSGDVDWATYSRALLEASGTPERLTIEEAVDSLGPWAIAFPTIAPVQEVTRRYLAEQSDHLGLERRPGESADAGVVREALAFLRVRVDAAFARELSEKFVAWDRLDPDLRTAVAIARTRTEGERGFREVDRARQGATSEADRLRFERALGWTSEPALVERTLALVLSGEIQRGHLVIAVRSAASNPVGRPLVGPWLEANLPRIADDLRGSGFLAQLLEHVVPWVGLERPEATRRFFREHPFPEGARGLAKGLEGLELFERVRDRFVR
jgi:tricorn protease interacting factor F2/3